MHAEAMLFVDNGETESSELHFLLEQCMRADGNLRFAGSEVCK